MHIVALQNNNKMQNKATTRKRAIAKAVHLKGRTTSRQSFWRIRGILWVFRGFLFENIVLSDV